MLNIVVYFSASLRFIRLPSNVTALVTKKVVLQCAARSSSKVRIIWQKLKAGRSETLNLRGDNYEITKSGRLKFSRLLISNTGYYRCMARANRDTIQSDYVYLKVEGEFWYIYYLNYICF